MHECSPESLREEGVQNNVPTCVQYLFKIDNVFIFKIIYKIIG